MDELWNLFFNTLFKWLIVIDFNRMNIHEFLESVEHHSQVLLLYMIRVLRLFHIDQ